jgi:hypothetical protein
MNLMKMLSTSCVKQEKMLCSKYYIEVDVQ